MAMDGRIPTTFDALFPHGAYMIGKVSPVRDYKRSTAELAQQEVIRDEAGEPVLDDNGQPIFLWQLDIVEADDDATGETKFRVKIAAPTQPVPPPGLPGAKAVRPVILDGIEVRAWVNSDRCKPRRGEAHRCGGRVAWSLFATGLRAPGTNGQADAPRARAAS